MVRNGCPFFLLKYFLYIRFINLNYRYMYFVLRTVTDHGTHNDLLGESYVLNIFEPADRVEPYFGQIEHSDGFIQRLNSDNDYYIMTSRGETFEKISDL